MNYSLARMGKDENYQSIYKANTVFSEDMSVKLIFELNDTESKDINAERLWVTITDVDGDKLVGVIDNEPLKVDLKEGDTIHFVRQNVFDVYTE